MEVLGRWTRIIVHKNVKETEEAVDYRQWRNGWLSDWCMSGAKKSKTKKKIRTKESLQDGSFVEEDDSRLSEAESTTKTKKKKKMKKVKGTMEGMLVTWKRRDRRKLEKCLHAICRLLQWRMDVGKRLHSYFFRSIKSSFAWIERAIQMLNVRMIHHWTCFSYFSISSTWKFLWYDYIRSM